MASLQLSLLINPASRERRLGTTKTTAGLIIMKRRGHTRLLFFPFLSLLRLPFTNSSAREEEEDGCIDKDAAQRMGIRNIWSDQISHYQDGRETCGHWCFLNEKLKPFTMVHKRIFVMMSDHTGSTFSALGKRTRAE